MSSNPGLAKKLAAELLGTFVFVLVGAGSAVGVVSLGGTDPASSLLVAALANGLGLAMAVSATMAISGGSLNPAVTVALLAIRKLSAIEAASYIVAELAGATLAGIALVVSLPSSLGDLVHWGAPSLSNSVTLAQGTLLE